MPLPECLSHETMSKLPHADTDGRYCPDAEESEEESDSPSRSNSSVSSSPNHVSTSDPLGGNACSYVPAQCLARALEYLEALKTLLAERRRERHEMKTVIKQLKRDQRRMRAIILHLRTKSNDLLAALHLCGAAARHGEAFAAHLRDTGKGAN